MVPGQTKPPGLLARSLTLTVAINAGAGSGSAISIRFNAGCMFSVCWGHRQFSVSTYFLPKVMTYRAGTIKSVDAMYVHRLMVVNVINNSYQSQ